MRFALPLAFAAVLGSLQPALAADPASILNVSYDVARELFVQVNDAYLAKRKAAGGAALKIEQSHAGSSTQARARSPSFSPLQSCVW